MEAIRKQPEAKMTIVKGHTKSEFQQCIDTTWQVAHSALWSGKSFTDSQQKEFFSLISGYYRGSKNKVGRLTQIIERILLAKRYVDRARNRYVPKPADWLNIHFTYGISGTKAWYDRIKEERKKAPHYNEGIRLFAEGIWQYCLHPTSEQYLALYDQMIQHDQHDLIEVLHHFIAIHRFGK